MGTQIRLFFNGIANSLSPDGYNYVVTSTRKLGDSTKIITKKTRLVHRNDSFKYTNARKSISTTA
jgi:hypothetical protein